MSETLTWKQDQNAFRGVTGRWPTVQCPAGHCSAAAGHAWRHLSTMSAVNFSSDFNRNCYPAEWTPLHTRPSLSVVVSGSEERMSPRAVTRNMIDGVGGLSSFVNDCTLRVGHPIAEKWRQKIPGDGDKWVWVARAFFKNKKIKGSLFCFVLLCFIYIMILRHCDVSLGMEFMTNSFDWWTRQKSWRILNDLSQHS